MSGNFSQIIRNKRHNKLQDSEKPIFVGTNKIKEYLDEFLSVRHQILSDVFYTPL